MSTFKCWVEGPRSKIQDPRSPTARPRGDERSRVRLDVGRWTLDLFLACLLVIGVTGLARADLDYAELLAFAEEGDLRQTVEVFSSVRSRVAGYPGCTQAADYIRRQFKEIGLQRIRTEEYGVTVPVDEGATLRIMGDEGAPIPLYGIWPNLVRTSTLPPEGLQGPLMYAPEGEFADYNGHEVEGSITLMEFNTWNNWINGAMLGTKAVIFIEPDSTAHTQGDQKYVQVPLRVPRFWISKEEGRRLAERLQTEPLEIQIQARMTWQKVPTWNLLGEIPGMDPVLKDEVIVVEAYYDAMSVVPALAPGAEMSCSITGLLQLARYFKRHPPSRTLVFLATSAHHLSLRGISDFLQRHLRKEEHYAALMTEPMNIKLFIALDLSSQTDEVGIWNSSTGFYHKRFFAPFGKTFMRLSKEVANGLGYDPAETLVNGISPTGGMSWETFVPGNISVDSEIVLEAGTPALAFVTVNDARFLVDTPLDVPDRVNYGNLARQIRFLAGIFRLAFDDPKLFPDFRMKLKDTLRGLQGRVMTFPRRSIVPDRPRPGAVAVVRTGLYKSRKGVRAMFYEMVDEHGQFKISSIRVGGVAAVEAYYMDPNTGNVIYAPNRGAQASIYKSELNVNWWMTKSMTILFPCIATDFYDTVDPRYLTKLSSIAVYGEGNTTPQEYGYSIGYGPTEPVGVLFTRPGEKVKISMSSGLIGIRFLLLNSKSVESEEKARGEGFKTSLSQDPFIRTSFQAARDMWNLDEARLRELKKYGIENQRLQMLHQKAAQEIALAEVALKATQWDAFMQHTRAALGIESRAYPDVKATQNDVIKGIVFFMALVLPCAFFAERLLFASPDIRWQILGFSGIFVVIWMFMSQVHPAFALSNPFVILLAFVILSLAVFVIALIFSRFNQQMKMTRSEMAVVHETDVSRVGASYAAFTLGISNMRRRKMRTLLTFITLLLLTFTVLSFTSVRSTLSFSQVFKNDWGTYEGALIRSKSWAPLEESTYAYAKTAFEDVADVVPRSWYISKAKNYIKVKHIRPERATSPSAKALGVIGLRPEEAHVTGLDKLLVAGAWFQRPDERTCIIPTNMADLLDIEPSEVGEAEVRVFGEVLKVRGILDARKMDELKDLDEETLTPADFQVTGSQAVQEQAKEEQREKQGLETPKAAIRPFFHLDAGNVLILPYQLLREVGGSLQSVAVRFHEGVDVRKHIERFISRLAVTLFAGIRDPETGKIHVSVYSSLGVTSFRGLSHLFIPILIAALIVLNTMMGSVYERFKEIGIYSSVGLAPVHVAFLFIAESWVYAVLGTVSGYLVGQGVAKLLIWRGWLSGFTLNYSSLSAVTSSLLVMAVVLLSAVYPARKASQMAVPDVTRRWKLPEPEGDEWRFDFPFTVGGKDVFGLCVFLVDYFEAYNEESIGVFYTKGAHLGTVRTDQGEGYTIDMDIWLAPFDLGVSQHLLFRAFPIGEHNVYAIELYIQRLSGERASWKRANQRFVNVIRKQFLIWRTVAVEVKEQYRERGRRMLAEQAA